MTDIRTSAEWMERSKIWAATTVQGKSQDDSFNQMIIAEAAIVPGNPTSNGAAPSISSISSLVRTQTLNSDQTTGSVFFPSSVPAATSVHLSD